MTISVANHEAGAVAAAQAREAEIRQAARDTHARITGRGHEDVITLPAGHRAPAEPEPAGPRGVNTHPGPDFWGGEAA